MNKTNLLIFGLIILALVAGIAIYRQKEIKTEAVSQENTVPSATSAPEKLPIVHYPVDETAKDTTIADAPPQVDAEKTVNLPLPLVLPEMENSDSSLQELLLRIEPKGLFSKLLILDNFIPRFVVTIDNLPEKKLPHAHLPVKPPKGRFLISGSAAQPQTSSKNHQRYEIYVKLLESFDPDLVIKIYKHFYPLFQTAYKQLGYRNAYFNDRLIQVLNHLLETPAAPEPQPLSQPLILFTFTDPALEKLSSGQKILLRIGPDNRRRVLKVISSYQKILVSQQ